MSNQGYGRNPLWSPEFTGRKPSFNDMGVLRLNPSHPLNQGLVAWWLFNEGAGTQARDLILGNKGSLSGVEFFSGGLTFDKSAAERSTYTDASILSNLAPLTFVAKYRKATTGTANLAVKGSYGACRQLTAVYGSTADQIAFAVYGSTSGYIKWASAYNGIPCAVDHTIVCSWNGAISAASDVSVLVDGVPSSVTITANSIVGSPNNDASYPWISGVPQDASTSTWDGRLYYLAIYNRILSGRDALLWQTPYGTPDNPRFLMPSSRAYLIPGTTPSGTQYTSTLTAANAELAGLISRQAGKALPAGLPTMSGAYSRAISKIQSAIMSVLSGSAIKQTSKSHSAQSAELSGSAPKQTSKTFNAT